MKAVVAVLCLLLARAIPSAHAQRIHVSRSARHDTSVPLRDVVPVRPRERVHTPEPRPYPLRTGNRRDPVVQSNRHHGAPHLPIISGTEFDGIGLSTGYNVLGAPSDSNGGAGVTQFVETVNVAFAVYTKNNGRLLYGPAAINTLFKGFGGACERSNDGDPVVLFDHLAKRWIISQFAFSGGPPFRLCVAVSASADALGRWHRYEFRYWEFIPDYPKMAVWPNGYYATFNMYSGGSSPGPKVCAYERTAMLQGRAARQQCAQLAYWNGPILAADLDGYRLPPAGSPEVLLSLTGDALKLWQFKVSWTNPANTNLSAARRLPIAPFTLACPYGPCIPQQGTSKRLDALSDRLMFRLAYRNFGTHQSLVTTHTVQPGSGGAAMRWYELRKTRSGWAIYQQSTFSPDARSRWMGSLAMDKAGNIALGYSISSSHMYPGIAYAARRPSAPKGVMEGENIAVEGGGSQTDLDRWGDYTSMSVDPVDDCTFWYTNQYLTYTGVFNWSTRVTSFRLPNCH